MFSNEAVVRIFRGTYPNIALKKWCKEKAQGGLLSIVDVGCGDQTNMLALADLGMNLWSTEITQEICDSTMKKFEAYGVRAQINVGQNASVPFKEESFDMILSWKSPYYDLETLDNYSGYLEHLSECS